jgi:transcriptional regulator GlxA family with amidase domain
MPRVLFVTVDWPTGAVFSVTVERFAHIVTVGSTHEGVRSLAETTFGLVILDRTHDGDDVQALLRAAAARSCSVLLLAELARSPITMQELIERAWGALAARGCLPSELPQLGRRVRQAIEQIRLNYHGALTVGALANAIHVSPSHLAHRFSAETGISVKDYVTKVRIEVARRLLLETDAKLESIADAVGFCDAPHLSRVFVQYTRQRPGEYRRRLPKQFPTRSAQDHPLTPV